MLCHPPNFFESNRFNEDSAGTLRASHQLHFVDRQHPEHKSGPILLIYNVLTWFQPSNQKQSAQNSHSKTERWPNR